MKDETILKAISKLRPQLWAKIPVSVEDERAFADQATFLRGLEDDTWRLLAAYVKAHEGRTRKGTGNPVLPSRRAWFINDIDRHVTDALLWKGDREQKERREAGRKREHPQPAWKLEKVDQDRTEKDFEEVGSMVEQLKKDLMNAKAIRS